MEAELHSFLASAVDEGEWLTTSLGRFYRQTQNREVTTG